MDEISDVPLPIPLKAYYMKYSICHEHEYEGDAKCLCKNCNHYITYEHLCSYLWNKCQGCRRKIWYNAITCAYNAHRMKKSCKLICFDCRHPYYKIDMSAGNKRKGQM